MNGVWTGRLEHWEGKRLGSILTVVVCDVRFGYGGNEMAFRDKVLAQALFCLPPSRCRERAMGMLMCPGEAFLMTWVHGS